MEGRVTFIPPPSRPINCAWASHYAEIYQRNHRRSHPFWICKKQHSHFKDTSASLVCRLISFLSRFSSCLIVFAAFSRLKLTLHNAEHSQINRISFVSLRCVFFCFYLSGAVHVLLQNSSSLLRLFQYVFKLCRMLKSIAK